MKISLTFLAFFCVLLAALVGQDQLDFSKISALPSKRESQEHSHYLNLYKSKEFEIFGGEKIVLAKEKKPIVIVNFWASWCKPCVKEFPDLNKLTEKYSDNILILGVNTDDEDQNKLMKKTKKKYNLKFPLIADKESKLVDAYLVDSIPFSVIYLNDQVYKKTVGIQDFMSGEFVELFDNAVKKAAN